ncbi:cell adhesion molecule 2, partial [Biomphalaria glabrata]
MPEYCLWFSAIITSAVLVQANALGVTTSWIKDTIDVTTTTLQCSWTVESGESPGMLFFSPNDRVEQVYFYCAINTGPPYRCLRGTLAQSRHYINSSLEGSVAMMIENLQYSDDATFYFCLVRETSKPFIITHALLTINDEGTTTVPAVTTTKMASRSTVLLPFTEANPPETNTGTNDFVTELNIAMPFILPPMIIAIFIAAIVLTVRGRLQSKEQRHQSKSSRSPEEE